jgi:hypothetical protein
MCALHTPTLPQWTPWEAKPPTSIVSTRQRRLKRTHLQPEGTGVLKAGGLVRGQPPDPNYGTLTQTRPGPPKYLALAPREGRACRRRLPPGRERTRPGQ